MIDEPMKAASVGAGRSRIQVNLTQMEADDHFHRPDSLLAAAPFEWLSSGRKAGWLGTAPEADTRLSVIQEGEAAGQPTTLWAQGSRVRCANLAGLVIRAKLSGWLGPLRFQARGSAVVAMCARPLARPEFGLRGIEYAIRHQKTSAGA